MNKKQEDLKELLGMWIATDPESYDPWTTPDDRFSISIIKNVRDVSSSPLLISSSLVKWNADENIHDLNLSDLLSHLRLNKEDFLSSINEHRHFVVQSTRTKEQAKFVFVRAWENRYENIEADSWSTATAISFMCYEPRHHEIYLHMDQ